jgi:hypothetical protein
MDVQENLDFPQQKYCLSKKIQWLMNFKEIVATQKEKLRAELTNEEWAWGEIIFYNGNCRILTQSPARFELIVSDDVTGELKRQWSFARLRSKSNGKTKLRSLPMKKPR